MSLQFNNTTSKDGMIQACERNLDLRDGAISDNSTLLKQFTADINLGLAKVWSIIFKSNGTWQWDDSNHTADYPIITTDIVSGQRDYAFLTDNGGNLILDIYKVARKNHDGIYEQIWPVDIQSGDDTEDFWDGRDTTGIPNKYDKTANGIIFDVIPDYNSDEGLKLWINREGVFFTSADTTKKPGFAGLFHEYPVLFACYKYAVRKGLKSKNDFINDMLLMEEAIKIHYSHRERDVDTILSAEPIDSV